MARCSEWGRNRNRQAQACNVNGEWKGTKSACKLLTVRKTVITYHVSSRNDYRDEHYNRWNTTIKLLHLKWSSSIKETETEYIWHLVLLSIKSVVSHLKLTGLPLSWLPISEQRFLNASSVIIFLGIFVHNTGMTGNSFKKALDLNYYVCFNCIHVVCGHCIKLLMKYIWWARR